MSCALVAAALLFAADPALVEAAPPAPAAAASVAEEPLFADIVARSRTLKGVVDGWIAAPAADLAASSDFAAFKGQAADLAALDMQAHVTLRERGADGDLKCILRGISEDMPIRLAAIETAAGEPERLSALRELSHLLDDNAAVILAPPTEATAPHLMPSDQ